ncbi:MAG: 4Fe-4S dicluster domain-containing protein [Dehalococcoidia bacterium]|nr:4Fe-4S dicluster domain-containing protein [Dehalococcoidia bacterium]
MSNHIVMKARRKPAKQGLPEFVELHLNRDRCKGCRYCVEICARKTLAIGDEMNAKGHLLPMVVEGADCAACGLCAMICPDFAIWLSTEEYEE